MLIKTLKHIEISDAFELTVFQCCKRYAEAVLVMFQMDVGSAAQRFVHDAAFAGPYKFIMYLQVFKAQVERPVHCHIHRIEERQAMRTAEYKSAVRHAAGSSVVEFVASYAVCFKPVDELVHASIIFAKTIQGRHPKVALQILFYRRNISAWSSWDRMNIPGFRVIAEKSVGNCSNPYITFVVNNHIRWYEYRTSDTAFPRFIVDIGISIGKCFRINFLQMAHERSYQKPVTIRKN